MDSDLSQMLKWLNLGCKCTKNVVYNDYNLVLIFILVVL